MPLLPLAHETERVLSIAAMQARAMGHGHVGTEHLLIGLMKTEDREVTRAFDTCGLSPVDLRRAIRARLPYDENAHGGAGELVIPPRTDAVLRLAATAATDANAAQVRPVHLLAAILREGRGLGARLLMKLGVDLSALSRAAVDHTAAPPPPAAVAGVPAGHATPSPERRPPAPPFAATTPILDKLGRDLSAMAREGKLSPVIGRRDELRRLAQIMVRKQKNNVCLTGEPGVGKTSLVEGFALKTVAEDTVPELRGKRIVEVGMAALVAGTSHRGDFEQRLQGLLREAADPNVILFIDEIHTMIGAGSGGGGAMDAADILKPALARGQIRCIGATTTAEYQKYIEQDAALARRFQPLRLDEPTPADAILILQGLLASYEQHHRAVIEPQAVEQAVLLSVRYLPDRRLPDKAIDVLDEAAARLRLQSLTMRGADLVAAAAGGPAPIVRVTASDVARVITDWTGIPVSVPTSGASRGAPAESLRGLDARLQARVIGQDHACAIVADVIRTHHAGLASPNRPAGVFLFIGPTGVGKTELAKALAHEMFGDESAMLRFDMSEFAAEHAVARLVGSPPGYKDSDEGGQLTNAVRAKPYSVVLLDEVEKAHPSLFHLFLQVFDEGRLTDARGKVADFTNAVVILTSNLGAHVEPPQAFGLRPPIAESAHGVDMDALKGFFAPELLNRIDEIVAFRPLGRESVHRILEKYLGGLREQLRKRQMSLTITPEAYDLIAAEGFSPEYGARHLRRVVERRLVRPLAAQLLNGEGQDGAIVHVTDAGGQISIAVAKPG